MAGHIHAGLMMQYALDAKESDEPWLGWEFKDKDDDEWIQLYGNPCWNENAIYRRKPKTISINGFDVPMSVSRPLEHGDYYFTADITDGDLYNELVWTDDDFDTECLRRQIVHLTKEAAIAHAKALLSFTERKE